MCPMYIPKKQFLLINVFQTSIVSNYNYVLTTSMLKSSFETDFMVVFFCVKKMQLSHDNEKKMEPSVPDGN